MIFTLAGAAMIGTAALFIGREKSEKEVKRLRILEGLLSFISYTEEEIKNFKTPLSQIFEGFSNDVLLECGFILTLRSSGALEAVRYVLPYLSESAARELQSFARGLGGGYTEGQSALCEVTLARLSREAEEIRENLSERVRMYRLIPMLIAASVIILLM